MSSSVQQKEEYKIFLEFSKHLGYPVSNIENRNPPEPDILCQDGGGNKIAFELTEVIDEGIARSTNVLWTMKTLFTERFNDSPKELKDKLNPIIGNADIFIKFRKEVSLLKCKSVVSGFIEYLSSFLPLQSGEFIIDESNELSKVIEGFNITQGRFDGPIWSIRAGGVFSYPIIETLAGKFIKPYKTDAVSIQLLAYFNLQPQPRQEFIDEIKNFIEHNISRSQLSTVWIYLYNSDKVYLTVSRN